MNVWAALAGGLLGTLLLTTVLRIASEVHLTRMDLPFLLGTVFTADRARAKAFGYLTHAAMGLLFALGYYGLFLVLGHHDWWIGTLLGLAHGLFSGIVLVGTLLPAIHPRMGSTLTDAGSVALLEPPGFLLRNYGPQTPAVSLLAHAAFGTIVAAFLTAAG